MLPELCGDIQELFCKFWQPYLEHPHIASMDATTYESAIRYPTDVKLLWEDCEWMYRKIKWWSSHLKMVRPRNKYKDQKSSIQLKEAKCRKSSQKTNQPEWKAALVLKKIIMDFGGFWHELKQMKPCGYFLASIHQIFVGLWIEYEIKKSNLKLLKT